MVHTNNDIIHKQEQTFKKIIGVEKRMSELFDKQSKLHNNTALLEKNCTQTFQGIMAQITKIKLDAQRSLQVLSDNVKVNSPATSGGGVAAPKVVGSSKTVEGKHYDPALDEHTSDSEDSEDDDIQEVHREPAKTMTLTNTFDPSTRPESD